MSLSLNSVGATNCNKAHPSAQARPTVAYQASQAPQLSPNTAANNNFCFIHTFSHLISSAFSTLIAHPAVWVWQHTGGALLGLISGG